MLAPFLLQSDKQNNEEENEHLVVFWWKKKKIISEILQPSLHFYGMIYLVKTMPLWWRMAAIPK